MQGAMSLIEAMFDTNLREHYLNKTNYMGDFVDKNLGFKAILGPVFAVQVCRRDLEEMANFGYVHK